MSVAFDSETVVEWAEGRAIDLWLAPEPLLGAVAPSVGSALAIPIHGEAGTFDVFEAMRRVAADDVRRVGLAAGTVELLGVGRRAGLGAVVGVAAPGAAARALHAAEADAIVPTEDFATLVAERYGPQRRERPQVLLNPGPALTTERVKRAAGGVDVCHREPEYVEFEANLRRKIAVACELPTGWTVVLLAGSGTSANEAALTAAIRPGKAILVVRNGVYGDRFAAIAERAGIDSVHVEGSWTAPIGVDAIRAAIAARPDLDALAVVHHETTTGVLNPVLEIAAAAHEAGLLTVVDAISSLGTEELPLDGTGIDFVTCTSNKCLAGLPGAAFVLVSAAGRARVAEVPPRSVYLDLGAYLKAADTGVVPFTPSIPALRSLDASLDEVLEEGSPARRRRLQQRAQLLDHELERAGVEHLVEPAHRSSTVRSLRLPPGVTYDQIHARLKDEGYVIYAGQAHLAPDIYRVCCMGAIEDEVLRDFGSRLPGALRDTGR